MNKTKEIYPYREQNSALNMSCISPSLSFAYIFLEILTFPIPDVQNLNITG